MLRLNKFLGCLKLEYGGLLLGWINLIASVIAIYATIFNYGGKVLCLVCFLIAAVIYALMSFFLIQGTKHRNHVMTQPFRIVCFLGFIAILFFIVLMITKLKSKKDRTFYLHHLFLAIVGLFVEFYALLVVDSLHKKFRDEKFNHGGFVIAY